MALNLKNGFIPQALLCVFNNIVASNRVFNIFFFSVALAVPPKSGIVTELLSLSYSFQKTFRLRSPSSGIQDSEFPAFNSTLATASSTNS